MTHVLVFIVTQTIARFFEKKWEINLFVIKSHPNWSHTKMVMDFGSPYIMDALSLLVVLVVVFISHWTYRFIERPGQRFFHKLSNKSVPILKLNSSEIRE